MTIRRNFSMRRSLAVALSVLLTGCATFSVDGGTQAVADLTSARIGQPVQFDHAGKAGGPGAQVDVLLRSPLTVEGAVQIALLNNRGLQAAFAQLSSVEADLVQAGRLGNPSFSFQRLGSGGAFEIERTILFDIVGLFTLPVRRDIESRRFETAQLRVASEAVRLASDTRKAYFEAVAAQQSAGFAEQVLRSAEAAAELSARMSKAGNNSQLDHAREQAFYAEVTAQLARTRLRATAACEQLIRLLGVWGDKANLQLPDRLPDLPATPQAPQDAEARAMTERLDILIAKRDAEMTASALGLSKATGVVNVLHAGYSNASTSGAPRENGYEIELALPLFDWGGARVAKAQAIYMQSVHRAADTAIQARSQVREAFAVYRTRYDLARHYRDEVVPLQKKISDETLLRYNGMLVSVFELLADARAQVGSVNAAIEAQRDFWLAQADLQSAISGSGGVITAPNASAAPSAQAQH